ncbi:MAG: Gfo/Idh/MocA family oxidoreductase [Planctomycetota bacterium]
MNSPLEHNMQDMNRRDFVKTTAALVGAAALPAISSSALANPTAGASELRILQVGAGGIAGMDRGRLLKHKKVKFTGFIDVDANTRKKIGGQFPDAFVEPDYRVAFADHLDKFDAVNVCTPDHTHIAPMMLALANDKHVYGQKPLVQQLEELVMLDDAIKAKPHLATQTGNQRMNNAGRRIATYILEKNMLGQAIEAWVWTGTRQGTHTGEDLPGEATPPGHLDWDLWLGPAAKQPYRNGIAPGKWRRWWDFGTGGCGDWGVHLLDIIMYAYPELISPVAVQNNCPRKPDFLHATYCQSTLTYEVDSPRFKRGIFPIHYNDLGITPSLRAIGIDKPDGKVDKNSTSVVCEGGTLLLSAGGSLEIFVKGKKIDPKELGEIPDPGPADHWHSWVDQALGVKDHLKVWTPWDVGIRITEGAILPGKAAMFPGKELLWDRKKLEFTNSQEATDKVVRRQYRDGFAPPRVKA